jgi:branched-chain amino acid transport system ATP-binding protein
MSRPLLELRNLTVRYGAVEAVKRLSLQVAPGATTCLIGANGAGKTTTLRAVSGLVRPCEGQVLFDGQDFTALPAHQRPGLGLAHCPEGRGVFPQHSVLENLKLGAWCRARQDGMKDDLEKVYQLFPRLRDRSHQLAGTLSGGEAQMLALGRALMARPKLLLLDEPSLGLAPQMVDLIFETIGQINAQGVTVLLVEQNAHQALRLSQQAWVLETGETLLQGPAQAVAQDPRVRQAYLGNEP